MKTIYKLPFLLVLFKSSIIFAQVDTIAKENLKEVIVINNKTIKLKKNKGIYEVSLQGTNFEDQQNTWEGLKNIPLLQVTDESPLKINGKVASIFINGIESNLSATELEDYLKSIDPKTVKQLEITTNPNASYESSVAAVLNIVLIKLSDNYRLSVNSTNGVKTNYYNFLSGNYAVNVKNTSFYTNYSFSFLPKINSATITRRIQENNLNLKNRENDLERNHLWFSNLNHTFSKKSRIDFAYSFSASNDDFKGNSYNEVFNRSIYIDKLSNIHKLSQVWKYDFNDSTSIDIGSYQIFRNQRNNNFANENNSFQNQGLNSDINLIIGFVNFKFQNLLGQTSLGFRINKTTGDKENFEGSLAFPFKLNEQISSLYLNHSFEISKTASIDLGVRSESSNVSFSFFNPNDNKNFSNKSLYTNLLYNATYNWENKENKSYHSLGFRKSISRPNYNYLNPFQSINRDVTVFEGDFNITPSKLFIIAYEKSINKWNYYVSSGVNIDFISSFYAKRDNNIVLTYQNFDEVRFLNGGVERIQYFFNKRWECKTSVDLSVFKIYEDQYEIGKATPDISFNMTNIFDLGHDFKLNFSYFNNIAYNDGTLLHYNTQRFDIGFSKKIHQKFSLKIFINDLFKSSISGLETTLPNYLYKNVSYNDVRAIGINLRYNFVGKLYKYKNVEEPTSTEIDRLD